MLEFTGSYFDGKTSRAHAVHIVFDGSKLRLAANDFTIEAPMERIEIEPVLGNTRRVLHLDDRVCDYIAEFASHGKQWITIRHVLAHRAASGT
ncbi:MAG: beta-lactamase family protein, partial [Pleurocapsa sp. SU_196_0]|nr:beta-lactamase family protein [Pleurocapsa sp. SU_196_0]